MVTAILSGRVTVHTQAYRPVVAFSVTVPDGQTHELSAPEGGLATVTVGGREYGFRPTMMDDLGERIVITAFDMGDSKSAVKVLGEADSKAGGPVVTIKATATPSFRVKVGRVAKSSNPT